MGRGLRETIRSLVVQIGLVVALVSFDVDALASPIDSANQLLPQIDVPDGIYVTVVPTTAGFLVAGWEVVVDNVQGVAVDRDLGGMPDVDWRVTRCSAARLDSLVVMDSRPRARVYVDGFNLYMGALKDSAHKWLDLEAWADRLMPTYSVDRIVYCTARLQPSANDSTVHIRQDMYLRALGALPRVVIREGHFKVNATRMMRLPDPHCTCCDSTPPECRCCRSNTIPVLKREEKGSDVRLAIELLHDGFKDHYDTALVVSGDSDIQPAVDVVCQELGKRVIVADPRNRTHAPLKGDERRRIRPGVLAASQLPLTLVDSRGNAIAKPSTWS